MKKIIIITVLLLITTIALAALYFSNLFMDGRNSNKVLGYIPADAAVVLQFTNDDTFYEIFKDYQLFNSITGKIRESDLRILKSALLANPQVSPLIQEQKVFLSFHTDQDSVNYLWLSMLNNKINIGEFLNQPASRFKAIADTIPGLGNNHLLKVSLQELNKPFYIYMDGSVVIGSFSKKLLQRSINKQETKISEAFIEEIGGTDIKNQNSLINLYFNLETLKTYLGNYFKDTKGGNFTLLNGVKGGSTLNLNFKSDALMFNGISKPDTASSSYLNLFLHQKPIKNTLMRVVPRSTSNYLLFGLSNFEQFTADLRRLLEKRSQLNILSKHIQKIADENGINPERDIKELWGNEFITFQTANHEKFAAIKVSNGSQLEFLLEPLSKPSIEGIRRVNYPDIFYFYFGDALKDFRRPYYFIADNNMFIANSSGALNRLKKQYTSEQLLYRSEQYRHFEQLVANESNISAFFHNNNSRSIARTNLKRGFSKAMSDRNYGLKNFYGLSYQLSSDTHHFYTNLYIGYKPDMLPSPAREVKDSLSGSFN